MKLRYKPIIKRVEFKELEREKERRSNDSLYVNNTLTRALPVLPNAPEEDSDEDHYKVPVIQLEKPARRNSFTGEPTASSSKKQNTKPLP